MCIGKQNTDHFIHQDSEVTAVSFSQAHVCLLQYLMMLISVGLFSVGCLDLTHGELPGVESSNSSIELIKSDNSSIKYQPYWLTVAAHGSSHLLGVFSCLNTPRIDPEIFWMQNALSYSTFHSCIKSTVAEVFKKTQKTAQLQPDLNVHKLLSWEF